ncbi:hypothetical protein HME9304_00753 [Flagellimonas maritima]|uniref:Uncharacterized protein n=1 Tax=Flagellimonas maritima TaxID=1383885 RepID=A0A2Z4LPN7_9FLAO|nr:hypothetical protein HME9304_00753 [Allomuricauda aurantiaca]
MEKVYKYPFSLKFSQVQAYSLLCKDLYGIHPNGFGKLVDVP